MHAIIRRSLCAAVFAGGLLALGAGAASAAEPSNSDALNTPSVVQGQLFHTSSHSANNQSEGLLGGLLGGVVGDVLDNVQVAVPVTVPVNVSGNAVGVLGNADSTGSTAVNTVTPGTPSLPVTPLTPVLPTTPETPTLPTTPLTPLLPTTPTAPTTPGAPSLPATPALPHSPANPDVQAVHTPGLQAMGSGIQMMSNGATAQLAYTGTGLWPIFWSIASLMVGMGLMMLRRVRFQEI